MNKKRFSIVTVIALCMIMFSCENVSQPKTDDRESARVFVQQFYDWYNALYNADTPDKKDVVPAETTALSKKADFFDAPLRTAIIEDQNAQAKVPDDIVGLDSDPFLNAQDIGFSYQTGNVKQSGSTFAVDVHSDMAGKTRKVVLASEIAVVAEVVKVNGKWKFTNFIYPSKDGDTNLLDLLKGFQKERDKQVSKK
jgi:Protein of unknown function (DUF3828)